MISEVENILKKYNLLNSKNTFIIGFSGGYDSYCLLDIMTELSKIYNFTVIPAHLNHNWRGNESLLEQKRCEEIAIKYGLNFITDTLNDNIKLSEDSARNKRYEFFEKYAKLFDAIVLTAHNANDNAETLIYRITKGTGIFGLTGIPEFIEKNGIKYVRPMLNILRKDIENYCNEKFICPNQDSSNEATQFKRNFIRKEILPRLEQINNKAVSSINSLSKVAIENEKIINDIISDYFVDEKILFKNFSNASYQLKAKIIHKFLEQKGLNYDRKKITDIVDFLSRPEMLNKKYSLTTDLWLKYDKNYIYFINQKLNQEKFNEIIINGYGNYQTSLNTVFEVEKGYKTDEFPKETDLKAFVELKEIRFPFTLRTRKDGDIIQPFGMKGKMKLKKYLINKRIPKEKRDVLPVLAKGNEIFWVIGVGISEKLRVAQNPDYVFKYKKRS